MYNILIAPDSFKGTLTAEEVCDIIGKAFSDTHRETNITKLPVADGGEGLCSCMENICGGKKIKAVVSGVFGKPMEAGYLMLSDMTAVIEMAACAGLPLAGDKKDPSRTTTRGVGELIKDAVSKGAKSILLGLGGSATNDCGTGMADALGWEFLDKNGEKLTPTGKDLIKIKKIIPPEEKINIPVICACDVENPLYGKSGAAFVFAEQKGADKAMIEELDEGLRSFSEIIKNDLGRDVSDLKGAGAAGGLGAGAVVFLGARLEKGIDIILDRSDFDKKAAEADLIITGEGRLDSQSVNGKVISGVASRGKNLGKKIITICGCKGEGAEEIKKLGVEKMYFSCPVPKPFDLVKLTCREDLYTAAKKAAEEIFNK